MGYVALIIVFLSSLQTAALGSAEGAAQDRQAYETAQRVLEDRRRSAIDSYKLAGESAQKLIQYDDAMSHLRDFQLWRMMRA